MANSATSTETNIPATATSPREEVIATQYTAQTDQLSGTSIRANSPQPVLLNQTGSLPEWSDITIFVPFLTLGLGYWLGQFATRRNNVATLIQNDIAAFGQKIEVLCAFVKIHQRGNLIEGTTDLKKSREKLTDLRKEASSALNQIHSALKNTKHQKEWNDAYGYWKQATDGETGLITRKTDSWPPDAITKLDEACDRYLNTINRFRRQVASHKISLNT